MKKVKNRDQFVWPDLVVMEFLTAVALTIILLVWALLVNAPLLEIANPGISENPSKAPWYFVGLQELLVYFDPWIAGFMIPCIIIGSLMMIPYLDNNPHGSGRYAVSLRKFAVINFLAGFSLWWILIVTGYFLRGADWRLDLPFGMPDAAEITEGRLWNLPSVAGISAMLIYFTAGLILPVRINGIFFRQCGINRYVIVMILLLLMYAVPIKIFLRLVLDIRYVLVTPWFNI